MPDTTTGPDDPASLRFTGDVERTADPAADNARLRALMAEMRADTGRSGVQVSIDPRTHRVVVTAPDEGEAMALAAQLAAITLDGVSWGLASAARELLYGSPLWEQIAARAHALVFEQAQGVSERDEETDDA